MSEITYTLPRAKLAMGMTLELNRRTLFIAAGPLEWGSSRMRAWWVSEYLEGATCVQYKPDSFHPNYDDYIFQKIVDIKLVSLLKEVGHRVYWDVCDPSWWWMPKECRQMADMCDGVVASSQPLADDFNEWYGKDLAVCIPDRLKLEHYPIKRQHRGVSPVRFIWYGVSVNRIALVAALANMERLAANGYKIELTIMDDRPQEPFRITDAFPIYNVQWELARENEIIASHDVALLPPYPGPWGNVKSDNKDLTAWACGLPVWDGLEYGDGEYLMGKGGREYMTVQRIIHVSQSAAEWKDLLNGAHS